MAKDMFRPDESVTYRITRGKMDADHTGELCHPVLDANGKLKIIPGRGHYAEYIMVQLIDCPEGVERIYISQAWLEEAKCMQQP